MPLNGPAPPLGSFSVYRAGAVSLATGAVVTFETVEWDVNNWYDETTNFRYTPLIPGYYSFSWVVRTGGGLSAGQWWRASLYKNAAAHKAGQIVNQGATIGIGSGGSARAVANGSTDTFTIVVEHNKGSAEALTVGASETYFAGELVGRS